MILYDLRCSQGHTFEAWFKDSGTFDQQAKYGDVECPTCSDTSVEKAIMAPRLSSATRKKGLEHDLPVARSGPGKERASEVAREILDAVGKVQKHVEDNCENVGENFADEARAIHYGEAEERGIYGKATETEVEDLVEEDIPVSRIPWKKRKLS
ncbi:MAG: DUF1178 family protein [Rhodospirillaceae bacterium]|jgi:hypothetical protein|nr:DUF1178 family protein [Rhodospirillaceae bacterium]MBT7956511.1 DUF1178 family protein [Rhodospirillaceae bacterium]